MSDTTNLQVFAGNGSPAGTPLFPVVDGATGRVSFLSLADFQAAQRPGASTAPQGQFPGAAGSPLPGVSPVAQIAAAHWGPPTVDGQGNAVFVGGIQYAIVTGAPAMADGTITATYAPGSACQSVCLLARFNDNLDAGLIIATDNGSVVLENLGVSKATIGSYTGTVSQMTVRLGGGDLLVLINGQVVGSASNLGVLDAGHVGFGTYYDNAQMLVSAFSAA